MTKQSLSSSYFSETEYLFYIPNLPGNKVSEQGVQYSSRKKGINQQGAKAGDFFSNADRLVPNYILCFPWPKGFSTLDLSHWTILVGPWRRCDLEWKEGSIEPKDDSVAVLRTVL
ncbi:hypothetical protein B0H14DRAFT_2579875 [Mycena olivaceomarginata]|nr:hypothetical protein B0H14DRAFT_2579875 [Mycena olivaceomarginata]